MKSCISAWNREKDHRPRDSFLFLLAVKEMNINSQVRTAASDTRQPASAEERLKALGIDLPSPPEPFGAYVEAVETGNLLQSMFLP